MPKQQRRTYSDEQRALILKLYKEHGAGKTGRVLMSEYKMDVPIASITAMARRAGIQSDAPAQMKSAVEAAKLTAEQRNLRIADGLRDQAERLLERFRETEIDHKGVQATKVEYDEITFQSAQKNAKAITDLLTTAQLLSGGATNRTENVATKDELDNYLLGYADAFDRQKEQVKGE